MTTHRNAHRLLIAALASAALLLAGVPAIAAPAGDVAAGEAGGLDQALRRFVDGAGGPAGIVVVVQQGNTVSLHTAGVADLDTGARIRANDRLRLASVAKAFSGAAAVAVVADGRLNLDDTIGDWLPDLPESWAPITLVQLMNHTSGLLDFSRQQAFLDDLVESLEVAPPPEQLLTYVEDEPPSFTPGSRYRYSNTDNIVIGLMVAAATGRPYEQVLKNRVFGPLRLSRTSLPSGPDLETPFVHGYDFRADPPEDVSEAFAAGWTWASGGIVSTPADANRFIRGYASGALTNLATKAAQYKFIPGKSEPPGPGFNSAGPSLFRYQTICGTMYGHTGNTAGYTNFVAATANGLRSVVVSINSQITPDRDEERFAELRAIYERAVCAALS